MPAAMSAIEQPAFAGSSGVPVTDRNPDSLWISRSYAFLSRYGPSLPYPAMSQTMTACFSLESSACDTPRRAAAPGARFCTTTSDRSTISRLRIACPALCLTSSVRLSFDRLVQTKCDASPLTRSSYARAKSPTPGRSILMTRAPRSASCRVQNGAAIACSSVATVMPSSGRIVWIPPSVSGNGDRSERPRQAEHVLGDVREDQVRRYRRHLVEARFAELALDVVFVREAESTMCLHADVRGFP